MQVTSGILPAGMTITASCCKAYIPDYDDDAVAVDYASICNTASNSSNGFAGLALTVTAALVALYFLQ